MGERMAPAITEGCAAVKRVLVSRLPKMSRPQRTKQSSPRRASSSAELTLIFPCYNELPHLHDSIARIDQMRKLLAFPLDVLFVDDGSSDGTREALRRYAKQGWHVVFHEQNQGRGAAVTTGIRSVRTPYVGYVDIDLEVDVFQILPLLKAIREGGDVVLGQRVYKLRPAILHRYVLSVGYMFVSSAYLGTPRRDTESGFKLFRREAILPLLDEVQARGWFWDTEIVARAERAGLAIKDVPVLFWRRSDKYTSVRLVQDIGVYLRELRRFRQQLVRER